MARYTGVRPAGAGIEIRYQVHGQRVSHYVNVAPTDAGLQDAARLRRRLIQQAKLGDPDVRGDRLTFLAACTAFLQDVARERKPSTALTYQRKLSAHWSALAHLDIRQVTVAAIKAADRDVPWRTQKTRKDSLSALSGVMRWAIAERYITDNPVRAIKVGRHQRPEIDPFTADEIADLVPELRGAPGAMFQLMLHTGCRTGELQALEWSDVADAELSIAATIWKGERRPTKTSRARRVKLTAAAKRVLRQHTASRFAKGWVFATQQGNAYDSKDLTTAFKAACERAAVRYRRPYTLRHTYASRALSAGVEPSWLAEQMGDRIETVLRHYARWIGGERDARELAKLEKSGR